MALWEGGWAEAGTAGLAGSGMQMSKARSTCELSPCLPRSPASGPLLRGRLCVEWRGPLVHMLHPTKGSFLRKSFLAECPQASLSPSCRGICPGALPYSLPDENLFLLTNKLWEGGNVAVLHTLTSTLGLPPSDSTQEIPKTNK